MQLTMNLDVVPIPPKNIIESNLWIDVSTEARLIGFTQKVEISQQLSDALRVGQFEEESAYEQRVYDATWLAHHYLSLYQRSSFSFTLDFLQDDPIAGRLIEYSLRLRLELCEGTALLGLKNDF